MISLLLLGTLATSMSKLPEPIGQQRWMTNADYPESPRQRGEQGALRFRLTIDESGKPNKCEISKSSGSIAIDNLTCALMMRRAKFKPARDAKGAVIPSIYSQTTTFQIMGEAPAVETLADMGFIVRTLPRKAKRALLTLRVIVREDGKLDTCEIETSSGLPTVDAIACETVDARGSLYVAHLADGKAVRTMQGITVAFVAESK